MSFVHRDALLVVILTGPPVEVIHCWASCVQPQKSAQLATLVLVFSVLENSKRSSHTISLVEQSRRCELQVNLLNW